MPVYDFKCPNGHDFEALLGGFIQDESTDCPTCGEPGERVLVNLVTGHIPKWMTDSGMAANAKHREWLKTPEAKAMNLEKAS